MEKRVRSVVFCGIAWLTELHAAACMGRAGLAVASALLVATAASPQDLGQTVYDRVAKAVFVIEARDASGKAIGQGTAFFVANNTLVTAAHVIATAHSVVLKVSGLSLPCAVERTDLVVDLALLRFGGDLTIEPLALATGEPRPGTTVFAMGNPLGLDRTISQGLITGTRIVEGRPLLQLSAPISPGSSGGPVVQSDGAVLGVAVGLLENGQALSFAVPLGQLRDFLENRNTAKNPTTDVLVADAKRLAAIRDSLDYSAQADSQWQRQSAMVAETLERALAAASGSLAPLLDLCEVRWGSNELEQALRACDEAAALQKPLSDSLRSLLVSRIVDRAITAAQPQREALYRRALPHAAELVAPGKLTAARLSRLASIQEELPGMIGSAHDNYLKAHRMRGPESAGESERLMMTSAALGRIDEALRWADYYEKRAPGDVTQVNDAMYIAITWHLFANRLEEQGSHVNAGKYHLMAATKLPKGHDRLRYLSAAAWAHYMGNAEDEALTEARLVIAEGALLEHADGEVAEAHRLVATISADRQVFEQAISHGRQAIALDTTDAFAHHAVARGLVGLERYDEAVSVANEAIRLTDGKYSQMVFTLGSAYFGQRNWGQAKRAYERVAALEPKDAVSASNAAAALYNSGYYSEALTWYEEALRRNPGQRLRDEVTRTIQELRAKLKP